jgi:osmoprotectant transport system substrate-binding protein
MLIAQLIIQMLQENGFDAIDAGSYEDVRKEVDEGKIDIYPEYTGYYLENPGNPNVLLKPAPANSKWALVISERLSENGKITNMSEFAKYVNLKKGPVKLICSPDFISDKYGLENFEQVYQFSIETDRLVVVPSYNFAYMWNQIGSDDSDINAGIAYTTSGNPADYHLVLLKDDMGTKPDFFPAPLVRKEIYDKFGEQFNRILGPLFTSLDEKTLTDLNSQSGLVGKQAISVVAHKYLAENEYFKFGELEMVQEAMSEMMANTGMSSITPRTEATSDMSVFPSKEHALFNASMKWPYLTWRTTRGTYTCDGKGRVIQETTGW